MLLGEGLGEPLLLEFRGKQYIDFDECRKLRERQPRWGFLKVVERNHIAHVLQPAASGDDFVVGLNRLEDFQNDTIGGKRRGKIAKEKVPGAVDECATAVREAINAKKEQAVDCGSGGGFRVRAIEEIPGPGAEEQFVAVDFSFGIKNRLAREEFFHGHFLLPNWELLSFSEGEKGRDCQSWFLRRVFTPDSTSKRGIPRWPLFLRGVRAAIPSLPLWRGD